MSLIKAGAAVFATLAFLYLMVFGIRGPFSAILAFVVAGMMIFAAYYWLALKD